MKIALFDPSESFRGIFKATVQEQSADVTWYEFAGIGQAPYSCLQQDYDVIVTSSELEGTDFCELLKQLHASDYNPETPVFLFTSQISDHFFDRAFQLGITDIYTKSELLTAAETLNRMISFTESVPDANILLVEDDRATAAYYASALSDLGLTVHQASSCESAQALLDVHPIELVITDISLDKGGQGQRIVRKVRHGQTQTDHSIPVMVISGSSAPQYKSCLFYLGIDDYVVKPILPREMCLRAIHLIQKYRAEKSAIKQVSHFKEIAHYDNVTGGYSRHGFLDVAHFCVANCKRQGNSLGLLYLDLDDFKPVNDQQGHAIGDVVLTKVVEILKTLLREQDVICRWGGDEFVVLLQNCGQEHIEMIAYRVKEQFSKHQQALYNVGCSIGLSQGSPHSMAELLTMIDQADKAMYFSKKRQKGTITHYCFMQQSSNM